LCHQEQFRGAILSVSYLWNGAPVFVEGGAYAMAQWPVQVWNAHTIDTITALYYDTCKPFHVLGLSSGLKLSSIFLVSAEKYLFNTGAVVSHGKSLLSSTSLQLDIVSGIVSWITLETLTFKQCSKIILKVGWLVGWEINVPFQHKNGLYRGQCVGRVEI